MVSASRLMMFSKNCNNSILNKYKYFEFELDLRSYWLSTTSSGPSPSPESWIFMKI